jgi:hypothetical protein
MVSAAGKNMPVLVSPVVVIAGAAAVPAAKVETPLIVGLVKVCPDAVVTNVPLAVGNVSVVVPDTAGAAKVTVPDVSPATTIEAKINLLEIYYSS